MDNDSVFVQRDDNGNIVATFHNAQSYATELMKESDFEVSYFHAHMEDQMRARGLM